MCQGRSTPDTGNGHPALDRNPWNGYGYVKPYSIGLMSLSLTMWKQWELIRPIALIYLGREELGAKEAAKKGA